MAEMASAHQGDIVAAVRGHREKVIEITLRVGRCWW